MTYDVAVSRDIAAPPAGVWEMVADLPRMGEWSEENRGGRWLGGATGPGPGVRFKGVNRSGFRRWSTTVTVVECEPGKVFEFAVSFGPAKVARWRYEFEESAGGCRVTESWADLRHPFMRLTGNVMGEHSAVSTRRAMTTTLENLSKAAGA